MDINGRSDNNLLRTARMAGDVTNATTTLAALTGLSVQVFAGRKYAFRCVLFCVDSTAADGVKLAMDGGTATATDFRAHATAFDTLAANLIAQITALATTLAVATLTGASRVEIDGTFEPATDGTFAVRGAQNAHSAGTLTVNKGSYLLLWDVTP